MPALLPALQPPFDGAGWLTRLDGLLPGATRNVELYRCSREPGWPDNPHDPARAAATPPNVRTEVP